MRLPALPLAAVLLLAACSATTVEVEPPPPTDGSPTAEPSVSATPMPPALAEKAVYQLGGALFLYDVASDAVTQLTEPALVRLPRWMDDGRISFIRDAQNGRASELVAVDIASRQLTALFQVDTGIAGYGWSPDLDTVAYVTVDGFDFPQIHFRSISGNAVRTVATLARQVPREATDDDQVLVEFSPDGTLVLIVYTIAGDGSGDATPPETQLQVRTSDGALAFAPQQSQQPTMGVWAPDGTAVLFRTVDGARSWRVSDGRVRALPRRPVWFDPSVAPSGRVIAYDTGASDPGVSVRMLDLRDDKIKQLTQPGRALPLFASNRTLWAQRVRACQGDCSTASELVNEVVAVDIRNGNEKPLALRSLVDIDVRFG